MIEQHQVELIQQLTEPAAHMKASDAAILLPAIYNLILAQLPLPPQPTPGQKLVEPKINFSITESALYIFHLLAARVYIRTETTTAERGRGGGGRKGGLHARFTTSASAHFLHLPCNPPNVHLQSPGTLRGLCGINASFTGQPSSMATELATEKKKSLDIRLKYLEDRTNSYIQQVPPHPTSRHSMDNLSL